MFRRWREDDFELARTLFGDARVTGLVGGPFDDVQVRERLAAEIASERVHGYQYWPIFTHDGNHVGCCGLRQRAEGVVELGFYILPAYWRAGYASEAAGAVIEHAFGALGVTWLFAGHHPDNAPSRRTLEKLGFRYTHDEVYAPTGLTHPSYELVR